MSTVRRCVAKRSFTSSKATCAAGRPASRISAVLGIVLHAGKIPLAAITRALSIAAMCPPSLALTSGCPGRCVRGGLVRPLYQHSAPYISDGNTHAIVTLRKEVAGSPYVILPRLRICAATLLALAVRVATCRRNVSFRSNHTPSQRRAGWSLRFVAVVGCIVSWSLTMQGGAYASR